LIATISLPRHYLGVALAHPPTVQPGFLLVLAICGVSAVGLGARALWARGQPHRTRERKSAARGVVTLAAACCLIVAGMFHLL
jgi:hypothetical protein